MYAPYSLDTEFRALLQFPGCLVGTLKTEGEALVHKISRITDVEPTLRLRNLNLDRMDWGTTRNSI